MPTTIVPGGCRNSARLVPCHQVFQAQLLLSPTGAHHSRSPLGAGTVLDWCPVTKCSRCSCCLFSDWCPPQPFPGAGIVLDWCPLTKCSRCSCCFPRVLPITIAPGCRNCARLVLSHQVFQVQVLLSPSGAHHNRPRCRSCARLVPSHQVFQVQLLLSLDGAHHNRTPVGAGTVLDWCPVTKCSRCSCCFP